MIFSTIFAVVGVNIFGNTRGGTYMKHTDFSTFPSAASTLFKIAVGDDWDNFMGAISVTVSLY